MLLESTAAVDSWLPPIAGCPLVQSVLFFALGFLCAGFLALMVAPAVWRRAVALTRRRIEASIPLTRSEIQADKDRIRAEYAMATRRLEAGQSGYRTMVRNVNDPNGKPQAEKLTRGGEPSGPPDDTT